MEAKWLRAGTAAGVPLAVVLLLLVLVVAVEPIAEVLEERGTLKETTGGVAGTEVVGLGETGCEGNRDAAMADELEPPRESMAAMEAAMNAVGFCDMMFIISCVSAVVLLTRCAMLGGTPVAAEAEAAAAEAAAIDA